MTTELCLDILRCESEEAVSAILEDMPSGASWHPLDGRETNFNVVTNQADTGAKALTEICTNMVDAILMRYAAQKRIDPHSPAAPQSVIEAVRVLVELRGAPEGILAEVDDEDYLRHFATQNLIIGVTSTGKRGAKPAFTFVDSGEGQHATDFENTFLSLSSGRKKDIPFVQGKYNMGSSGVLSYCGRCWYKLIISRRFNKSQDWGWTLVRRRPGTGTPIAEFLKLDGRIPTLSLDQIKPLRFRDGRVDGSIAFTSGTVVKLYSYEFGGSANFRTVREAINENLISTILPFRLMDFRQSPDPARGGRRALGVDERNVNGMEFLLRRIDKEEEDPDEPSGDPLHIDEISHPELGKIRIQAVPLPRKLPGWLGARRNNNRVYHAVNGQVQFKQTRAFLSQSCKLPGIKDRIIILVDASDLTEAAHNDIWKGDRVTIRQTEVGNLYLKEIEDAIRSSEALKRYQRTIAHEETEHLTQKAQTDLFEKVLESDPHIAQLLPGGQIIRLPGQPGNPVGKADEFVGKYSPTFFDLAARRHREDGIDVPLSGVRRVRFRTDAVDDWFTRSQNHGSAELGGDVNQLVSMHVGDLHSGSLLVRLAVTDAQSVERLIAPNSRESSSFEGTISLRDPAMPEAVVENIQIRFVRERQNPPGGGGGRRPPPGIEEGDEATEERGLPPVVWLTRDGRPIGEDPVEPWPEGFTDQDGGFVDVLDEERSLYKVNYDNAHFQHFLVRARSDAEKRVLVAQYRLGMQVLMLGFEHAYANISDENVKLKLEESMDEFRRLSAQGAATVVMSVARTISEMVTPDMVGDPDD